MSCCVRCHRSPSSSSYDGLTLLIAVLIDTVQSLSSYDTIIIVILQLSSLPSSVPYNCCHCTIQSSTDNNDEGHHDDNKPLYEPWDTSVDFYECVKMYYEGQTTEVRCLTKDDCDSDEE